MLQEREGWRRRVIDRLAIDLKAAFPEMEELSEEPLANAGVLPGMANRRRDSATACGRIALGPQHPPPGEAPGRGRLEVVRGLSHRARVESHHSDTHRHRRPTPTTRGLGGDQLVESLPDNFASSLPSVEAIERELSDLGE